MGRMKREGESIEERRAEESRQWERGEKVIIMRKMRKKRDKERKRGNEKDKEEKRKRGEKV